MRSCKGLTLSCSRPFKFRFKLSYSYNIQPFGGDGSCCYPAKEFTDIKFIIKVYDFGAPHAPKFFDNQGPPNFKYYKLSAAFNHANVKNSSRMNGRARRELQFRIDEGAWAGGR